MPLLTAVEHYVIAALESAEVQELEDGTICATVPDMPGIIAYGSDHHECTKRLYAFVESWIKRSLARAYELPVLGGIDLNAQPERILASYYDTGGDHSERHQVYQDEQELMTA